MTLRALIVDDEATARRRLRRLMSRDAGIEVIGECSDGAAALETIAVRRPDVVLLDVQMPEMSGMDVARALAPGREPAIIFVTAYDRYAIDAFDLHAADYVLKPVSAERLDLAIGRVRERLRDRARVDLPGLVARLQAAPRYATRLAVRTGGRVLLVDVASIDWIEAADNYVRLHCGNREYLLRETLARLERQLDPARFVRVHRSAIVRADRVVELHPASHGDMQLVLRDGTRLTLSRTCREEAERRLQFGR